MTVSAPFTPDQVASLNGYQESELVHPYTCGLDDCPSKSWDDESQPMAADAEGLHCIEPGCPYTQSWVHGWTADWSWRERERRMEKARRRRGRRIVRQFRRVLRRFG